jgi:hypothetical protein
MMSPKQDCPALSTKVREMQALAPATMTPDAVATRLETIATHLRAGPDGELTVTAIRDLEHRLNRLVTEALRSVRNSGRACVPHCSTETDFARPNRRMTAAPNSQEPTRFARCLRGNHRAVVSPTTHRVRDRRQTYFGLDTY